MSPRIGALLALLPALARATAEAESLLLQLGAAAGAAGGEGHRLRRPRIFCFAWYSGQPKEVPILAPARKQYKLCDGHKFFADRGLPGPVEDDFVRVAQSEAAVKVDQPIGRKSKQNMRGLLPSWKHILDNRIEDQYDWIVNAEIDHIMFPSKVRDGIMTYQEEIMKAKNVSKIDEEPLILMFGNAFLFNRAVVKQIAKHWTKLWRFVRDVNPSAPHGGCPLWGTDPAWPNCPQDRLYLNMASMILQPHVKLWGNPGCGGTDPTLPAIKDIYCFQLWGNEEQQNLTVRQIASGAAVEPMSLALGEVSWREAYFDYLQQDGLPGSGLRLNAMKAFEQGRPNRKVTPFLHQAYWPGTFELASKLLGP